MKGLKTGGRQKGSLNKSSIKSLIPDYIGEDAINKVISLAMNEDMETDPKIQAKMLELLLAYKYGKPQQSLDLTTGDEKIDAIKIIMVSNGVRS